MTTTWACVHLSVSGPLPTAPTTGCGCAMHRVEPSRAGDWTEACPAVVICHPWMAWLCRADGDCRRPLVCRLHDAALRLSYRLNLIGA